LTLEEIGAKFGDEVEVTFEDAVAYEMEGKGVQNMVENVKND